MHPPWSNMVPRDTKEDSSGEFCGYKRQPMAIKGISDDVFPGVMGYIAKQDEDLVRRDINLDWWRILANKKGFCVVWKHGCH